MDQHLRKERRESGDDWETLETVGLVNFCNFRGVLFHIVVIYLYNAEIFEFVDSTRTDRS